MANPFKKIFWQSFNSINSKLKFPAVKLGENAIQLGFDMSAPITSDLFLLEKKIRPNGIVYGIDPDPRNIIAAEKLITGKNIQLINKAVYSEKGIMQLMLGEKASWNQLENIPPDLTVHYKQETVTVEMDTLDSIVQENNIPIESIGHINITINGSEYFALLGMQNILTESNNIGITVVAGRNDESGIINGKKDHELIASLLIQNGFGVKFKRMNKSLWWGFVVNLMVRGKWVFGKNNYGIIMAVKGNKKIPWYQTFS